ncbi:uncharacterized protein FPRO_14888 [Fusarium proliferatum ET1]|uniref:Uncharacterized protein n=1 Tax=Fusarium proliferatum (strain ET1) TaxID=1227346 RepID=A0A1L7WAI5_FUSPR|nr:uncharacterized protein FPRO_14888 [Fusarium proliferatum ET1]CZR49633.1 uncharacterized protein FPRO_14888 [Fusarium proliferatum ET1]
MKFLILIAPLLSLPLAFANSGGDYGYGYGYGGKVSTVTTIVTHTVTKPIYKAPITKTKTETVTNFKPTVTKYKTVTKTVTKKPYTTYHKPRYGDGKHKDSEYKG